MYVLDPKTNVFCRKKIQLHFPMNKGLTVPKYSLFTFKCHNLCIWQFSYHFWSFFCQLHGYLSQNLGFDVHFDVLNVSKFQSDQKIQHKKHFFGFHFFSILEEKILLIFDIENWLWKYELGIFWRTIIHCRIL